MRRLIGILAMLTSAMSAADRNIYVGTYTKPAGSKGIYLLRMDSATGAMGRAELAAELGNPSFLAVHPNGKFVFAVNEKQGGNVSAFAVEPGGKLRLLNMSDSKGDGPCHLNLDKTGKWLAVANYGSGSAAVLPVGADGKLGEAASSVQHSGKSVNASRQSGPHAHSVNFSSDNKTLYIADLGLDEVKVYGFDAKTGKIGEKAQLETPKGAGPRHLALGKNGFAYVLNEMTSSVSVFKTAGGGKAQAVETVSALPAGYSGNSSGAEIVLHPKGTLLFSSNRGHDSISIFRVDPAAGTIKLLGQEPVGGKTPRGFVLSPDGKFLLAGAQDSDIAQLFKIDLKEGKLIRAGDPVSIGSPVCFRFAPK